MLKRIKTSACRWLDAAWQIRERICSTGRQAVYYTLGTRRFCRDFCDVFFRVCPNGKIARERPRVCAARLTVCGSLLLWNGEFARKREKCWPSRNRGYTAVGAFRARRLNLLSVIKHSALENGSNAHVPANYRASYKTVSRWPLPKRFHSARASTDD